MANIINHAEQEFSTFAEKPFGDTDSLVLSQLSYIHFDVVLNRYPIGTKLEIRDLLRAEDMEQMLFHVRDPQNNKKLLYHLSASPRFRNMRFGDFMSKTSETLEEQFAAVTFYMDGQAYIVFRGTDSSLIGWKEDFNMAFLPRVPAQEDALLYLNGIAERFSGRLYLCGHSKGGNLAIYAAAMAETAVQARIETIFAHDAPGFSREMLESAGYRSIQNRIRKTIPQSSLIGMLLENHDTYSVVESRQLGIMQHDPFSWVVENGEFRAVDALTPGAQYMNHALDNWIAGMSMEERERFVDALYSVLSAGNITNVFDLKNVLQPANLTAMHSAMTKLDPETRDFLLQVIRSLGNFAKQLLPGYGKTGVFASKTEEHSPNLLERFSRNPEDHTKK